MYNRVICIYVSCNFMKNHSSFKPNPNFHIMCLYTKDLRKHKIGPAFDEQHNIIMFKTS